MSKFSREQEIEMGRQLLPWLKAKNVHPVLFDKLPSHKKVLLHNGICVGSRQLTDRQRRELYKDLGVSEGRKGSYYPTNKELREFFSSDGVPYLYKF